MFSNVETSACFFYEKRKKLPAIQASIWRIFIWKIREDCSLVLSCAIASVKFRLLLLRN